MSANIVMGPYDYSYAFMLLFLVMWLTTCMPRD
ncbi:hypothetical protein F383_19613 [Gossypium arboreum]|uniref:Uncharacterized protein n=1 Tax=Gossypium arboreum TaxID=29729 RepID=A0A0B0NNF1_GOSAR|nr:hypothetical protein F383_19613 [Gossypium arboreum]